MTDIAVNSAASFFEFWFTLSLFGATIVYAAMFLAVATPAPQVSRCRSSLNGESQAARTFCSEVDKSLSLATDNANDLYAVDYTHSALKMEPRWPRNKRRERRLTVPSVLLNQLCD